MKIAQIAPLYESVPPHTYGGTERVVSYLTESLVQMGHVVTLFASGDSVTSANLVPGCQRSLRLDDQCVDRLAHHIVMLDMVLERAHEFDVLHFHIDYLPFPFFRNSSAPFLTTLHGRLDLADLIPVYERFNNVPVISISLAQRKPLPWANWVGNVQHGLPKDLHSFTPGKGSYLAFLGRISPEKRPDRAIEIAERAGIPLKIAAKVDAADRDYYEEKIRPLLKSKNVEYIGEINEREKTAFLGNALAYLFPIDWPEPFGLTMIEAMACGTPTIAFDCGSVPEIMVEGETGYIVKTVDEAVRAVAKVHTIDRAACRNVFEKRFTDVRMAENYLRIYRSAKTQLSNQSAHLNFSL